MAQTLLLQNARLIDGLADQPLQSIRLCEGEQGFAIFLALALFNT